MGDMLSWLLAGHMAGDFIFQTRWMAEGKAARFRPLLTHSAVYTCCVWAAALLGAYPRYDELSPWSVLFVFVSHSLIDRRGITRWWCRRVSRSEGTPWLVITTDQSFHVVVLALVCFAEKIL